MWAHGVGDDWPQSTEQTPVAAPVLDRVGGWIPGGWGSGCRAQGCSDEQMTAASCPEAALGSRPQARASTSNSRPHAWARAQQDLPALGGKVEGAPAQRDSG